MNQSERKLRGILGLNKPLYLRMIDNYIDNPLFWDLFLCFFIIGINIGLVKIGFSFFQYDIESINDILNELISSSLSAGGFVLAALAIIASIKQTVNEVAINERPKSGKEYFYSSVGYKNVIKIYSVACIIFLCAFILFSFIRGCGTYLSPTWLHGITLFGILLLSTTFLRCILLLWALIRIP